MPRLTALLICSSLLGACDGSDAATKDKQDPKSEVSSKDTPQEKSEKAESKFPEAATLLAESVEAVGGKAKLESVDNFHLKGVIEAPKQNLRGEVETWWQRGDFYMVQTIPGLGINRSGKLGDEIWAQEPINGLRKLEGKEAEQHTWASSLMLAADWERFFDSAQTVGERELKGKKVYDIELTSASGATLTLTLDAQSKLMVEQSFEVHSPMGSMPVAIRSMDYRDVDGMKIPYKQVTDAKIMTLTQELTTVELNPGVDAKLFALPEEDIPVVRGEAEVEGKAAQEPEKK